MRHISAVLDVSANVVKVLIYTRLWDVKLVPDNLQGQLTRFSSLAWSTSLESMLLGLPDNVLATKAKFLQTHWLLYNDQLHLHRLHKKCFWLLLKCYGSVWSFQMRLSSTIICMTFKSHMEWNKAQCLSSPTTTILPTTNHSTFLPWLELLWSCDIYAANWHLLKYCKTFDSL